MNTTITRTIATVGAAGALVVGGAAAANATDDDHDANRAGTVIDVRIHGLGHDDEEQVRDAVRDASHDGSVTADEVEDRSGLDLGDLQVDVTLLGDGDRLVLIDDA